MIVSVEQKKGNNRSIRSLFIIGLVGLMLAASGASWLIVESAPLAHRATQYTGTWVDKQDSNYILAKLEISSSWLSITVHALGNCATFASLTCDWGTNYESFTGEPLAITFTFSESNLTNVWPITMSLSNNGTQLKVVVNNGSPGIFEKM